MQPIHLCSLASQHNSWLAMRQTLNAENIANVTTPGYRAADIENPQILESLLRRSPLPRIHDSRIKGLLAYSRGISKAAKTWLSEIDPRKPAPRSAAHLALAQTILIACRRADPRAAGRPSGGQRRARRTG